MTVRDATSSLGPLRLIYLGSDDVDADARFHVQQLGGELRFFLDRFGARVASVRHAGGADLVFASHLPMQSPIYFFSVDDRSRLNLGEDVRIVDTPLGSAAMVTDPSGRKIGIIEGRNDDYLETCWRTPGHLGAVYPDWLNNPSQADA